MAKRQPGKKASPSHAKPQSNKKQAGTGHGKLTSSTVAADKDGGGGPAVGTPDQKRILAVFAEAFAAELASDAFAPALQAIKQALFERDFDAAFGAEANLRVYAARYSPTRALCYADALSGVATHLDGLLLLSPRRPPPLDGADDDDDDDGEGGSSSSSSSSKDSTGGGELRALAIGGGAAEVAALAAFLRRRPAASGSVVLLDSGPWGSVVDALAAGLTRPPTLSKYASAEARASNRALVEPSRFKTAFVRADALALDAAGYGALFPGAAGQEATTTTSSSPPCLVTLLFTLNELFTGGGIGKTTAFLLNLSASVPSGSLLLVIDSPGSYSEAVVGKESKRYPMSWLLNKVLSEAEDWDWVKLESHDSLWFRLPTGLSYPIPLENMRYQLHLYRVSKPV
ncbi:hypothetical protein GGTG_06233 [Gaeumannomyces tritici R3-111a-1]|uniref:25S rRNA (Uridine(2843)-N(3))-methyltransferase n=1 Tax=Gaeumannomyces tritici (strain R3-111a-1) TaxID=644352 RepID=J3NY80_GAET3|nr:hypothetical protein GGTG_06233 [Gaeumannomyces tritici R3-111a-1]EJT76313.1 hypothetical protein GGTG_06233 [Gaeumannomyces tritici R3-111a-1]